MTMNYVGLLNEHFGAGYADNITEVFVKHGADHQPAFTCTLTVNETGVTAHSVGAPATKKLAKQSAAQTAQPARREGIQVLHRGGFGMDFGTKKQ